MQFYDRFAPCKYTLAYYRWGVLFIGIFQLWRVDDGVRRSDEGEEDDDADKEANGGAKGGVDRCGFELGRST